MYMIILFCLAIIGQGIVVNGIFPVIISQLEKNFGYTSLKTSTIQSFYTLSCAISSLLIGIFEIKKKLLLIGIGVLLMAIGCFVFIIPHFLNNYNTFEASKLIKFTNFTSNICSKNKKHNFQPYIVKSKFNYVYLLIFFLAYSLIGNYIIN